MKTVKVIFLAMLTTCVSSCSSKYDRDQKLLKDYFTSYFSNKIEVDSLSYTQYDYMTVSDSKIPGLEGIYTVDFEFVPLDYNMTRSYKSGWGGRLVSLTISTSGLSKEYVEYPVNVSVQVKGVYSETFVMTLRFKPYTHYFGKIFVADNHLSYDSIKEDGTTTEIFNEWVTSGHFYKDDTYKVDFTNGTFEFKRTQYEKDTSGAYNFQHYSALYYFASNNPRIEGLSTGTFYIDGSTYNATNTLDDLTYHYSKKVNDVFKKYNDNRFITLIS